MRPIPETPERCAAEILRGWFECSGPKRASELARDLAMPRDLVDQALAQLEAEGQILRGQFTPGSSDAGMVPPAAAGAHPPPHHRAPAPRNRAGHHGRVLRVSEPLAAPRAGHATARRGWHAADHPPVAGLRICRGGVGNGDSAAPRGALPARVPGPALPCRRSELGAALAASGLRARARRERKSRRVRPTRVAPLAIFLREDAAGCWPRRSLRRGMRSRTPRAKCWRRSKPTARPSSPT